MTIKKLLVTEGSIPFTHPYLPADKDFVTWYRVVGDLKNGIRPLVTLHGGPGASHAYLKPPFDELSRRTGRPVVYYDQVGTGKSTHHRERRLDTDFWTIEFFMAEIDNVISHLGIADGFDLFGHSWGAMLAAPYSIWPQRKAEGLGKIVLGGGPASMKLFEEGMRNDLLRRMPQDVQDAIDKGEREKDYDSESYKTAIMAFYRQFMCRLEEWPAELLESLEWIEKDDTVYFTMQGPSELTVLGSLKSYDMTEEAKKITLPTLIINGEFDEAQDISVEPWFWPIPKAKWVTLADGSHMAHLEHPEKYAELVDRFLSGS